MTIRKLRLTILVVVLVGLTAVFAWERLSIQKVSAEDKTVYEQLQIFSDVLDIVQENYVEEADSKELVEGAITGMLKTLDPHSSYLNPDAYKELQVETKGSFGGIGIEITIRDGFLTVVSPLEGTRSLLRPSHGGLFRLFPGKCRRRRRKDVMFGERERKRGI